MKAFIIILALVAASFAAVVVYGVARDRPAATAGATPKCGDPPPVGADGEVDEDALEDWCPPDVLSSADWIRRRFGPGLAIDRPDVSLPGAFGVERRPVPPADDEFRVVNLVLTAGASARVTAEQDGADDKAVCLCRSGALLTADDTRDCHPRWIAKQTGPTHCLEGADGNSLPLAGQAATLSLTSAQPAEVRVK